MAAGHLSRERRTNSSRSRSTRCCRSSPVGILDVVELRDVLARYSASRAVRLCTDEEIETIEALNAALDDMTDEAEPEIHIEAVLDFLAAVSAAAHSPLLFVLETALNRL